MKSRTAAFISTRSPKFIGTYAGAVAEYARFTADAANHITAEPDVPKTVV